MLTIGHKKVVIFGARNLNSKYIHFGVSIIRTCNSSVGVYLGVVAELGHIYFECLLENHLGPQSLACQ